MGKVPADSAYVQLFCGLGSTATSMTSVLAVAMTVAVCSCSVEMNEMVYDQHVDVHRELRSGQLLKWMDICACLAAELHAER